MSNQNYDQVPNLSAQGLLNWQTDAIVALLLTDAEYDGSHKRLSEVGARFRASSPIQGRWLGADGEAMGLPASFGQAQAGLEYQVIVAQDDGRNDPVLLAFIGEDSNASPINVQRGGTLIVRPTQDNPPEPPDMVTPPPTTGMWMKL